MEPELAGLLEQVEAVRERARQLVAGLDDRAFNWSPQRGVWSVAQCIMHLNLSAGPFLEAIDRGMELQTPGQGPFRYGPVERWFLRTMEPPVKTRVRTARKFEPPADLSRDAALSVFLADQDRIVERIRRAQSLHLSRIKVTSPFVPVIRYSLGIALALMVAHERRHLWQAEQLRAHAQFPHSQ